MAKAKYRILRIKGAGRVAVKNTSRLPDTELDELLRFGLRDLNVGPCVIHVGTYSYAHSTLGKAYYQINGYGNWNDQSGWIDVSREIPKWCRHMIILRWGRDWAAGNKPRFVNTIAHEGKHIEEYREGRWMKNSRHRQTEAKARALGWRRQRDYENRI